MTKPPVRRRLPDDIVRDPAELFQRIRLRPGSFWLDSGQGISEHGRFHYLGAGPDHVLSQKHPYAWPTIPTVKTDQGLDSSDQWPAAKWVGYLAYDLGATLETLPKTPRVNEAPDAYFARYPATITIDTKTKDALLTGDSANSIDRLIEWLRQPPVLTHISADLASGPESIWGLERFVHAVERAKEYIAAGDVYQVNLSHRFEASLRAISPETASDLYLKMRAKYSAPYGAFLSLVGTEKNTSILSNSPEGFLDIDLRPRPGRVATWPLKGTRPISGDSDELLQSTKDRAEHVMIVDLERNDLGRIARTGTVNVSKLMEVIRLPTVLHLESCVEAIPNDDVVLDDILRACFPGGSITGAPKVRAMQIISELEQEHRHVYCGALGYIDFDGYRSRWSIPIRTALMENERISFRSGSGIVSDSNPVAEWQETLDKSVALITAITD